MMNDKNKNFDNYVKKALADDPIVPAGLEWESMDIEIPQKNNRRKILYYILGGMALGAVFLAGYMFRSFSPIDKLESQHESIQYVNGKDSNTPALKQSFQFSSNSKSSDKESDINKGEDIVDSDQSDISQSVLKTEQEVIYDESAKNAIETIIDSNQKVDVELRIEVSKDERNINTNNVNEVEPIAIKESVKDMGDVDSALSLEYSTINVEMIPILKSHLLSSDQSVVCLSNYLDLVLEIDKKYKNEISFRAGGNVSSLNVSEGSALNGKISNFLGVSANLSYGRNLSDRLFFEGSVNYNELHTVFEHSFEIERLYNFTSGVQTVRQQNIYKNNFAKSLALSVGLGYRIAVIDDLELRPSFSINAMRLLSHQGFTLENDEVVDMGGLSYAKDLDIGISPSLELRYRLATRFSFNVVYTYNRNISNGLDFGNNVIRKSTNQLLSGFSIEF